MSTDNTWKYSNATLFPPLSLEDVSVESGQLETRYNHVTPIETHHYRLVTNWVCAYDESGTLITAILYRRTDDDWLHSVRIVLVKEEISDIGQPARQYAVKKHAKLVADHLSM